MELKEPQSIITAAQNCVVRKAFVLPGSSVPGLYPPTVCSPFAISQLSTMYVFSMHATMGFWLSSDPSSRRIMSRQRTIACHGRESQPNHPLLVGSRGLPLDHQGDGVRCFNGEIKYYVEFLLFISDRNICIRRLKSRINSPWTYPCFD